MEVDQSIANIDPNNLDKECIRLPGDYLRFAHLSADKKKEVDILESKLKLVTAELSDDIRKNPGDYGLEKVTEDAIKNKILLIPRYQKNHDRLIEARHQADLAQSVVWALEHKKRSLTLLVDLHGMGYFSDVPLSKEGKQAIDRMTENKVRRRRNED